MEADSGEFAELAQKHPRRCRISFFKLADFRELVSKMTQSGGAAVVQMYKPAK